MTRLQPTKQGTSTTPRPHRVLNLLVRIMHRFSSRSAESTGLTRRAIEAPASVLYGTLRRLTERNNSQAE